jgi:hypothetical protein
LTNGRGSRRKVNFVGRGLRATGEEFSCESLDISGSGALIAADVLPAVGEVVIIYLRDIGRLEGEVVRAAPKEFALKFTHSQRKKEEIEGKLLRMLIHAASRSPR